MNLKDSCDHHVFDVTGKSPLMCSYLGRSVTQSHPVTNRVLIGRTELLPQTSRADPVTIGNSVKDSSSDNLTYAQFVARQFKDTRKVLKDVTEKETQFNKELVLVIIMIHRNTGIIAGIINTNVQVLKCQKSSVPEVKMPENPIHRARK